MYNFLPHCKAGRHSLLAGVAVESPFTAFQNYQHNQCLILQKITIFSSYFSNSQKIGNFLKKRSVTTWTKRLPLAMPRSVGHSKINSHSWKKRSATVCCPIANAEYNHSVQQTPHHGEPITILGWNKGNFLGHMARKQMGIAHTVGLAVLVQKEIGGTQSSLTPDLPLLQPQLQQCRQQIWSEGSHYPVQPYWSPHLQNRMWSLARNRRHLKIEKTSLLQMQVMYIINYRAHKGKGQCTT